MRQLVPLFEAYTQVRKLWERLGPAAYAATRADLHDQLQHLFAPGFLVQTPWPWLMQFSRYLRGIARRIEKLPMGGGAKDAQLIADLQPLWQRWKSRAKEHAARDLHDAELVTYRWMLEEYRILLFAQELGTAVSVSAKRLEKQWAKEPRTK
jgi:ATP-dependent helicase HrpA